MQIVQSSAVILVQVLVQIVYSNLDIAPLLPCTYLMILPVDRGLCKWRFMRPQVRVHIRVRGVLFWQVKLLPTMYIIL
ncbi:hypothetical protein F4859DRAFT_498886 [Xylaria cf. heliscus]|nr:hypothetical protein F4859DRAFT_498886 [Xylaria cf. heliscus]